MAFHGTSLGQERKIQPQDLEHSCSQGVAVSRQRVVPQLGVFSDALTLLVCKT